MAACATAPEPEGRDSSTLAVPLPSVGLTAAEVASRVARGDVNSPVASGRRYRDIVRDNVLTPVNAILAGLLVISLLVGPLQDATFGAILLINILVSLVQELRAKRTLDRLAVVAATRSRVVRDGRQQVVAAEEVVLGDLVELTRGDQAVADMRVVEANTLEIDESLITGESQSVAKLAGEVVLSGSSVSSGDARCRVTAVSQRCYASSVVARARHQHLMGSTIRGDLNRLLLWLLVAVVPTSALLLSSELHTRASVTEALRGAIAGTVAMVPEGLILLTSMTFAVGVLRLSRRRVLVQELPAMEMLARADVLCLDKTGTITEASMAVSDVQVFPTARADEVSAGLGALARLDREASATMRALQDRFPPPPSGWTDAAVAFSSQRGWSAVHQAAGAWWVLGGADIIMGGDEAAHHPPPALRERMARGERLLVLAITDGDVTADGLPPGLRMQAAVGISQALRPQAAATIGYFADQGVALRVLSGDNPTTVAAVAQSVGVRDAAAADARALPFGDPIALGNALAASATWGRVRPEQKESIVQALRAQGHTVAMLGDGVNDVLALRASDIGIAMGSGSPAARAAARAILLDDDFGRLPSVVTEGRRLIGNVERVSKLFLTKAAYAVLLALLVALFGLPFPFWSRHLTLVAGLTVGVPGFLLALAPNASRVRAGSLRRAVRFALPAGLIAGATTLASYHLVDGVPNVPFGEAQTVATLTLIGVGLWLVSVLKRPLRLGTLALLAAMAAALAVVFALPIGRAYFALDIPPASICVEVMGVVTIAGLVIELLRRLHLLGGPDQ
jgi:cation-transporting ATPase E